MISLIIPTLNEEKYLPLLLESIKKQDFTDYEIIVADAGSKDNTVAIAQQYGCQVIKGGLLPFGRNRGADIAKGDALLFLDADVILPAHFLTRTMKRFNDKKAGIAGFPILPSDGKFIDEIFYRFLNIFSFVTQKLVPYTSCAILVTKEIHKKIGGFDENILFIEDYPYGKAASKVSRYVLMTGIPFYTSARRFEKDGRWQVYTKYILAQLHMLFLGPVKSDLFKYKFGHYDEEK